MPVTNINGVSSQTIPKNTLFKAVRKDIYKNRYIYLMVLPVLIFYIVFHYIPMYGAQIAFKNFNPAKGIIDSPWIGFKHFMDFFNSYYFLRLIRNTLLINIYDVIFGFPAPIILALLLNEVKNQLFKRTVQTVTYVPHFISIMVISGIIIDFLSRDGLINQIIEFFGAKPIQFMIKPEWFRTIFVSSGIWQHIGWGTIIYLAALSAIDPQLYEACMIDGGNRFKQMFHITLPGITPTIIILLVLRLGQMMNVGSEKILLLYNPNTYEAADVISTFVYRKGILDMSFSYSAAVGVFNSVINFAILFTANKLSRKMTETSLW